jgi:asparagine synthase (glutamine-hydrolysing)
MCGICGVLDFSGRPVDPSLVDRMRDAMVHRGPDDKGTLVLPYIGLGHRRLSIIDLSPRGHQPMPNEDGTVWLVFNGEIYNFPDLRRDLEKAGHRFASETDSEVLIHGYEEWSIEGLLDRVNGMFAFALWDAARRQLVLARDRLGKKPLYYGRLGGRFLFASEIKALWAFDPGAWTPRADSMARFLYWRYLPGAETIYRDVHALLPAHYLVVRDGSVRETRYWRVTFATKFTGRASEVIDRTDEVVAGAVRRRLRSDVPLGAFLSGGIDSSYVVSWMAADSAPAVHTFSIGFDDQEHDERPWAARVARHCRTAHTEFLVTPDAWSLLPRLVWEFGQPFGDAAVIPTYYVAERARRRVTVALTGDGGDESFAGYSNHQAELLAGTLGRFLPNRLLDGLMTWARPLLDSGQTRPLAKAARFLRYAHSDPLIAMAPVTAWSLHHLHAVFPDGRHGLADRDALLGYALRVRGEFDGESDLDRALHYDLNMLLPFCYNVKLDVASMMSSVETRCPFQDREVVEWAAQVDPGVKMRPWETKHLLKLVAARRLPREVIDRPKHGFSIPLDRWFMGAWAAPARDLILGRDARRRGLFDYAYIERLWAEHQSGVAQHGTRFWLLLWLELWHRLFVDRSMGPADRLPSA